MEGIANNPINAGRAQLSLRQNALATNRRPISAAALNAPNTWKKVKTIRGGYQGVAANRDLDHTPFKSAFITFTTAMGSMVKE